MSSASIRIILLGRPRLKTGLRTIDLPSGQSSALVAILALSRDAVSRETLASLLWPRSSRRSSLHSLSQYLYKLRQLVGRDHISASKKLVSLTDVEVDYHLLHEAVAKGSTSTAASLVGGSLLGGETVQQSAEFEQWIDRHRAEYRELLYSLLNQLVLQADWEQVDRVGMVLRNYSPHDPRIEEVLNRSRALRRVATCISDENHAVPRDSAIFVGRTEELQRLKTLWEQAGNSRSAVTAIVSGPPGIGKTVLVDRFLRYLALKGATSLFARAFPAEQRVPFGIVEQLLNDPAVEHAMREIGGPWEQILLEAFPRLSANELTAPRKHELTSALAGELQIYEAICRVLSQIGPIAIFVDNADWCDAASFSFLHYLGRSLLDSRILLLLATRKPEPDWRDELIPSSIEIRVPELSLRDTQTLLDRLGDSSESPAYMEAQELFARSGGNPLLIRLLISGGGPKNNDSAYSVVGDVLRPRLDQLSSGARHLLAVLSVLGDSAEYDCLFAVGELSTREGAQATAELVRDGLAIEDDSRIRSTHGLAGEVVLADSPNSVQRLIHAKAARYLRNQGSAPAAVLAVQYDVAGEPDDAYEHAMKAATASLKLYAHREAQFFYKLALSHAPSAAKAVEVRLALAKLLMHLGKPKEAYEILDCDLASVSEPLRLWVESLRLRAKLVRTDEPREEIQRAWDLVELAQDHDEWDLAGTLLATIGTVAYDLGLRGDVVRSSEATLAIASRFRDSHQADQLKSRAAALLALSESAAGALEILSDKAEPVAPASSRLAFLLARGSIRVAGGLLGEAESDLLESAALAEQYGLHGSSLQIHNNLGVCYIEGGRYDEAERFLQRALELSLPINTAVKDSLVALDNLGILEFERGEYEAAIQYARRSLAANQPIKSRRSWFCSLGLIGLCSLQLGRMADAAESERELRLGPDLHDYWLSDISYVEIFLARILTYRGDRTSGIQRLRESYRAFEGRDFFCCNRMKVEQLRLARAEQPRAVLAEARNLLPQLKAAGARPLAERLSAVVDRLEVTT